MKWNHGFIPLGQKWSKNCVFVVLHKAAIGRVSGHVALGYCLGGW